jgi:hypothetical protein
MPFTVALVQQVTTAATFLPFTVVPPQVALALVADMVDCVGFGYVNLVACELEYDEIRRKGSSLTV